MNAVGSADCYGAVCVQYGQPTTWYMRTIELLGAHTAGIQLLNADKLGEPGALTEVTL